MKTRTATILIGGISALFLIGFLYSWSVVLGIIVFFLFVALAIRFGGLCIQHVQPHLLVHKGMYESIILEPLLKATGQHELGDVAGWCLLALLFLESSIITHQLCHTQFDSI